MFRALTATIRTSHPASPKHEGLANRTRSKSWNVRPRRARMTNCHFRALMIFGNFPTNIMAEQRTLGSNLLQSAFALRASADTRRTKPHLARRSFSEGGAKGAENEPSPALLR